MMCEDCAWVAFENGTHESDLNEADPSLCVEKDCIKHAVANELCQEHNETWLSFCAHVGIDSDE